ncbi:MAG TPA: serine/threonine-protein kinase, partial [Gemmatimonadaceae bacterium]|nr:serine/threonine-protein kinase [Gemmatimonadaceae bacterium]
MSSDDHDSGRASHAASAGAESAAASERAVAPETSDVTEEHRLTEEQPSPLSESAIGSGRLAQQRTPTADASIAVPKVCPQCGSEYETTDRFCPKDGSPLRPKAGGDPLVGRVIADRYLVLALLGEGGMGRVYLGEHVKMNRQCAIKVMSPTLVNDAESLQRFAREASNAARILHPNVAAVFDYGESEKVIYLVMEYVDGESLSTILAREGTLEPRRAIEIARQIADGLHAAHELGIVHRDLKPDNVIVAHSRSGREIPKVVDFGIAKALTEAPQDALTRSGLVIGTPEYMSPEQLLGDPVDARADIYSLGCILYQMLTGAPAFAADTREQMIRRRLHEAPPHLREVLPDLPSRLDTLIVHMLARSPADRLASAAEARDQLDPALAMGGWDPRVITAPSLSPGSSAAVGGAASDAMLRPTMPLPRQKLSVRRISAGVAIGAGLLLASLYLWTER